jgi:hypothetical protein
MNSEESEKLNIKIAKGIKLAIQRLVEKTLKEDGELDISINGKVTRVKARDLKPTED